MPGQSVLDLHGKLAAGDDEIPVISDDLLLQAVERAIAKGQSM